ncbi:protein of unknown function (plasmid) [Nitratireductor aquimarinus]
MPTQCCRRHATGANGEFGIGREHNKLPAGIQHAFTVEAHKRLQNHNRPVGEAKRRSCFGYGPQQMPFIHGIFRTGTCIARARVQGLAGTPNLLTDYDLGTRHPFPAEWRDCKSIRHCLTLH